MKSALTCIVLTLAATLPATAFGSGSESERSAAHAGLADLARGHEQVAKGLTGDHTSVVLQKGDKQFTIYGVVSIRAVGAVVEITVKNGEKYSVSAADIFFITNNGFKI